MKHDFVRLPDGQLQCMGCENVNVPPPPPWQSMKTAPREVMILTYGSGGVYVNRMDKLGQLRTRFKKPLDSATHWMPVPEAPPKGG